MARECSKTISMYFDTIEQSVTKCYDLAKKARAKGVDPEDDIPIPLAKNMAERVVGLISVVYPDITKTTVTQRITQLEKEYGMLDWRVGFKIAEEVAKENFCTFTDKKEAIEIGIRVGFAYLTLGIVSAPIEGFIGIKIKKRTDGKEFISLQYAGPIRGAGGTAASTSVILADYVRVKMGYAPYDPTEKEINRYTAEVHDYHERVTNLQYHPSDQELQFMVSHLPIEVAGDPTEKFEVSNYKDLPRIETNLIRGGMALVLAEGLCQKAPKLWKRLRKWGKDFDLEWGFLADFLTLKEKVHAAHSSKESKKEEKRDTKKTVKPNNTFIMDLVAGRPIITHPIATGGFRLRYGRTRASGFSAAACNPATLVVLDKFVAIGTQLKVERPGKAATITACDTLEGPVVRLSDGSVMQFTSVQIAKQYNKDVQEILFLGDILFNYGDFSENGHFLVPAGYCPEWWALELEKAIAGDFDGASSKIPIERDRLEQIVTKPLFVFPSFEESVLLSQKYSVALHPNYTYFYKLLSLAKFKEFCEWLGLGRLKKDANAITKIILPYYQDKQVHIKGKKHLEHLGVPHKVISKENIILENDDAKALCFVLGVANQEDLTKIGEIKEELDCSTLEYLNTKSLVKLKDKAGTFIGARMGRPEKAKMRSLTGSPQVMFPVGEQGGRLRSFQAAIETGEVTSSFPCFYCKKCEKETVYRRCEVCNSQTLQRYYCRFCSDLEKATCRHGDARPFKTTNVDIRHYMKYARSKAGVHALPKLIKGIRGTSNKTHITENLAKGILRAKHSIYVNKDGTTRYDCTELPLTHFKPKEINTSVSKLREIGYNKDIEGNELENDNQLLELKPQDIILPGFDSLEQSAPTVLCNVARFIDDCLVNLYGLEPFYNITKKEDLVGHLVIGLAPHISAGTVGRIIGFSQTQGLLTHPMYHAGLRRDCDGDEAAVLLLMDGLLNFSRQYLPTTRGSTMDSPLVLTQFLDPAEVDDQVHGLDVVWRYPLELYEAAKEMKNPWEITIEQLDNRLGTPKQYEDFGFTHHVENFNKAVQCSAYKTLPSMNEKLVGQMEIARKVRAVDMDDVAKLVIQKHFLKDIKGNLRKFSMQKFRCVKCNEKYRRPPLSAKCTNCSGRIIFTISHGSVIKYLGPSQMLAEKYDFSPYLKQTINMLQEDVDNIFGREKDKQVGLGTFMN